MVKQGDKVKCLHMDDPYAAVPSGTIGTVIAIDALGTIHVQWENGSSLGLIPGEDEWEVFDEN